MGPIPPASPQQLHLPIELQREPSFEAYLAGPNGEVVAALEGLASRGDEPFLYLYGPPGTGKTHLLLATCLCASSASRRAQYLPLGTPGLPPSALEDLERFSLVALDDLDRIAGDAPWEQALFRLFNALRDRRGILVAAASRPPETLGIQLPDLCSRLQWGPRYGLMELAEDDCESLLNTTARRLGMPMPREVVRYIMAHRPRDPASLIALVERLDRVCLRERRAPSIPLLKRAIATNSEDGA